MDFRNIPADGDRGHFVRFINADTTSDANITIKAVKLELGTVSTLANETAPNYQQELAKCQSYFVRIGKKLGQFGQSLNGYGLYASSARVMLLKRMVSTPTITFSELSDFKLIYNGKAVVPTRFAIAATLENFVNVIVDVSDTDLQYYPCCLRFDNQDAYIDFSAEL